METLEGVADPQQHFAAGVVIDGHAVGRDVVELVLILVGQVDALERELEVVVDRVLQRGVDVEGLVVAVGVGAGIEAAVDLAGDDALALGAGASTEALIKKALG